MVYKSHSLKRSGNEKPKWASKNFKSMESYEKSKGNDGSSWSKGVTCFADSYIYYGVWE